MRVDLGYMGVMGEYEGEGRIREELGFGKACMHYYQLTLQRKPPQLAPIVISENHLKFNLRQ